MQDASNNICCTANELNLIELQPNLGGAFNQGNGARKDEGNG